MTEDPFSLGFIFADSNIGKDIMDELELETIPSYVVFNTNKEEVARHEGEIDVEKLIAIFSELLPD